MEAARRRRLQELEEQKRHSWSGGEQVGRQSNQTKNTPLRNDCHVTLLAGGRSFWIAVQQ